MPKPIFFDPRTSYPRLVPFSMSASDTPNTSVQASLSDADSIFANTQSLAWLGSTTPTYAGITETKPGFR